MSPLIAPLIAGAIEIFKSKEARKDNFKKASTQASVIPILTALAVPEQGVLPATMEEALTQLALGVVAVLMVLYRKAK